MGRLGSEITLKWRKSSEDCSMSRYLPSLQTFLCMCTTTGSWTLNASSGSSSTPTEMCQGHSHWLRLTAFQHAGCTKKGVRLGGCFTNSWLQPSCWIYYPNCSYGNASAVFMEMSLASFQLNFNWNRPQIFPHKQRFYHESLMISFQQRCIFKPTSKPLQP